MMAEVSNEVVLVDTNDQVIGHLEKLEAHQKGVLHRAFSILLFNDAGEILLQQRAFNKYHSGGLWANTCCSHPYPDEPIKTAANRRLIEEMGIEADLGFAFKFIYKAPLDHGLTEHELDHVFTGRYSDSPKINTEEVHHWKWMNINKLKKDIIEKPHDYTVWLSEILQHPKFDSAYNNVS